MGTIAGLDKKTSKIAVFCYFLAMILWAVKYLRKILPIIFWNFTMFQYKLEQPQVKRNVITSKGNLVYELPHELPNGLRLRILGNVELLGRSQIWLQIQPSNQSPLQKFNFGISIQRACKSKYQTFLVLSSFTGFLNFVSNILPKIVEEANSWS